MPGDEPRGYKKLRYVSMGLRTNETWGELKVLDMSRPLPARRWHERLL